jgi:urea carboxylase system permease
MADLAPPAPAAVPTEHEDAHDLSRFGYRQELHRSLGSFSSFAAGFSYISIMTGVFQLFAFGFGAGGPASWWTWPAVFAGQLSVGLCFAELAGQFPLAGGVYQWSRRVGGHAVSWMAGYILIIGAIVTAAAVAVAYQVVLPQVSQSFEIFGTSADAGSYSTPEGAKNAIVLAIGLIVFTTAINCIGVKLMSRINNVGVAAELVGVTLLIILLAVHIKRGPQVITNTLGTGAGHPAGYLGAFLVAGIMSAYVLYGFDTAGTLAEETNNPRKHAPRGIIRALFAAFVAGGLLMLIGMMAVGDIADKNIPVLGMPYLVKSTLGNGLGDVFLIDSAIAITVCCLAVHTAAIRQLFSMARDGQLPFGRQIAKVTPRSGVPVVPAVLVGVLTIALLLVNIGNQSVFLALTSVAIILFYIPYGCATGSMLYRRLKGQWPREDHGPHFSLGKWGLFVNAFAVLYGIGMVVNLAWPRPAVYGAAHWYTQWSALLFTAVIAALGAAYYLLRVRPAAATPQTPAGS